MANRAGILALTAAAGCSGASSALPAGPAGAQSTITDCGFATDPCCGAKPCDAAPSCAGTLCDGTTTDGTPDVASPVVDAGSGGTDSTIGAPARDGGGDSVADGTSDDTTIAEPGSDGASGMDANVTDGSADDRQADDGSSTHAPDATPPGDGDAAVQGSSLDVGLVAIYHFDETSGTTSADSSGNDYTATMQGGATFSTGVRGNAATFSGVNQYVSLPTGIVSALTNFSISAWLYQSLAGHGHRVFDFGTGTVVNMFLTPDGDVLRYAVTTGGHGAEENVMTAGILPIGIWQHLAITQSAATGTLYVNGAVVAQNPAMTLHPSSLEVTTQNWIGRSQYSDNPYLTGKIDEFRIYERALSAAEVVELYQQQR